MHYVDLIVEMDCFLFLYLTIGTPHRKPIYWQFQVFACEPRSQASTCTVRVEPGVQIIMTECLRIATKLNVMILQHCMPLFMPAKKRLVMGGRQQNDECFSIP